jgi:tetratricopeptide (TPR) repeat protein
MSLEKTTRQGRVKEALGRIYDQHPKHFREYLRRYQQDPTSRVFAPLAEAYRRLGRLDEAIDICLEGLDHHPDFHGGRVALAKCYFDKRKFKEARTELERVIQYTPENLMAQRLLGETFLALKDSISALHCLKMALLLSPEDVALAEKVYALEKNPAAPLAIAVRAEEIADEPIEELAPIVAPFVPVENKVSVSDNADDPLLKDDPEDEAFHIQHVSQIFVDSHENKTKEITTETLANLYFSQGQYDRCLRILEKIESKPDSRRPAHPGLNDVQRKINACRMKLGISEEAIVANQKIELLRGILKTVRTKSS